MPMSATHYYFFLDLALPVGSTPTQPQEWQPFLASHFTGWAPAVQRLIEKMDAGKMARVEIHDTDKLPTLVDLDSGRALLMGDAAHATCPDIGQGGCQALEDGFVLQQLLGTHSLSPTPTSDELRAILRAYQDARGDRTAVLVKRARQRSDITHRLGDPVKTEEWYEELQREDGSGIMDGIAKTVLGAPSALDA